MTNDLNTLRNTAFRLCGTTDLIEAFSLLEQERAAMIELHLRNNKQAAHIRRLDELLRVTNTIVSGVQECGMMFVATSTQNAIARYRQLYAENEKRLQEALTL